MFDNNRESVNVSDLGKNKDSQLIGKDLVKRDEHGRILPGSAGINPVGRLPDKLKIDTDTLLDALKIVEKGKKKPFLVHAWERAYKSDSVLKLMIDKFVANKAISLDQLGNTGFNITIEYFGNKKDKDTEVEQSKTIDI